VRGACQRSRAGGGEGASFLERSKRGQVQIIRLFSCYRRTSRAGFLRPQFDEFRWGGAPAEQRQSPKNVPKIIEIHHECAILLIRRGFFSSKKSSRGSWDICHPRQCASVAGPRERGIPPPGDPPAGIRSMLGDTKPDQPR